MKVVPFLTFMMGNPNPEPGSGQEEGPQHKVKVDSFWMGTYEITWEQYDLFVNEEISNLKNKLPQLVDIPDAVTAPTRPYMEIVSVWEEMGVSCH